MKKCRCINIGILNLVWKNGIEKNEAKEIVKKFLNENKISCNDFLIKADGTKINILDAILSPTREYFNDIIDETKKSKTYIKQKGIFDAELFSFSSGGISYKINYTFEDIKKILLNLQAADIQYKIKCLVALESLLVEDFLTPQEIIELETILKAQGFLLENNSFCEKIFNEIKDRKVLKAMENYAVLLTNGSPDFVAGSPKAF